MAERLFTTARPVGVVLLLLSAAGHCLAGDLPPHGLYKVTVTMGAPNLVMQEIYASRECLLQTDLAEGPASYVNRQDKEDESCAVDEYVIGDDKIAMNLVCTFGPSKAAIVGQGRFSETGFVVNNEVKLSMQGLELTMVAVLTGDFIGPCAAEAD